MALVTPDGLTFERSPVDVFFPKRLPSLENGTCAQCGASVLDKSEWSDVDVAEYLISGTCPPCWSRMMGSDDEDD